MDAWVFFGGFDFGFFPEMQSCCCCKLTLWMLFPTQYGTKSWCYLFRLPFAVACNFSLPAMQALREEGMWNLPTLPPPFMDFTLGGVWETCEMRSLKMHSRMWGEKNCPFLNMEAVNTSSWRESCCVSCLLSTKRHLSLKLISIWLFMTLVPRSLFI